MGLDNIPNVYPCKKQGVAVVNSEGEIECLKTIESGLCPLHNKKDNTNLINEAIIPLGMFGADCWYRGKYGSYLLEQMRNHNEDFPYDENTLYGEYLEDEDGKEYEGISADSCIGISKDLYSYSEAWVHYVKTASEVIGDEEKEKQLINDWVYLAWWLNFMGEECNGIKAWY